MEDLPELGMVPDVQPAFRQILISIVGVRSQDQLTYLALQGITSFQALIQFNLDAFDSKIFQVNGTKVWVGPEADSEPRPIFIPYPVRQNLKCLVFFRKMKSRQGRNRTAVQSEYTHLYQEKIASFIQKVENGTDRTPPTQLSLTNITQWHSPTESFEEKLKDTVGKMASKDDLKVPLTYIIRPSTQVLPESLHKTYPTIEAEVEETFIHEGPAYDRDNADVWDVLKGACAPTKTIWSLIQKHESKKKGRLAYMSLKGYAEGPHAMTARINKAESDINTSHFGGDSRRFTLEHYISVHQTAHNELAACNQPMAENIKVTRFLAGIAHSANLQTEKSVIRGDATKHDNFENCIAYLRTNNAYNKDDSKQPKRQRIATIRRGKDNRRDRCN